MRNSRGNKYLAGVWALTAVCAVPEAFSITNGKQMEIPAIVRLVAPVTGAQCTGTIVGVNPLSVLTALHCLGDLDKGTVLMLPENPGMDMLARNPTYAQQNLSTSVVYSDAVEEKDQFIAYEETRFVFESVKARFEATAKDLTALQAAHADSADIERMEKRMFVQLNMLNANVQIVSEAFHALVNGSDIVDLNDAVYLVFGNSKRLDPVADVTSLVAEKKLIPVNVGEQVEGQSVLMAGYGIVDREAQTLPSALMGTVNVLRKEGQKGVLVSFGLTETQKSDALPVGTMGSILPGDSGGPLLTNKGIIGVNSRILFGEEHGETPPAQGWPLSKRNRYNYIFNEYIAMSSDASKALLRKAQDEGLRIELSESDETPILNLAKAISLDSSFDLVSLLESAGSVGCEANTEADPLMAMDAVKLVKE